MEPTLPIEERTNETSLFNHWRASRKHKRFALLAIGVTLIVSVIVSLLIPGRYVAKTTLVVPQQDAPFSSGVISSEQQGGFVRMTGNYGEAKSKSEIWVAILNSERVKETIVKRFNLVQRYHKKTIGAAVETLRKRTRVEKYKEDIITLEVEDVAAGMAASMANAFVEELDRMNRKIVITSGQQIRAFVEKRLLEAGEEMMKTEDTLNVFQNKNYAVKLDDQSKAMIEAVGNIKEGLLEKQAQRSALLSYATHAHPEVKVLDAEIDELEQGLGEFEHGNLASRGVLIPTSKIPDVALHFARLLRKSKLQETIYGLLTQQYEMARIQEARDSSTVQVLDMAKPPERATQPNRWLIALLPTLIVSLLSGFFIFLDW